MQEVYRYFTFYGLLRVIQDNLGCHKKNTKEVELKIQDLVWHNRFFISFDNINFYEHTQDQRFHNKKHQLNYTAD